MALSDLEASSAAKSLFGRSKSAIASSIGASGAGLGAAQAAQGQVAGIVSQINADADTLRSTVVPAIQKDAATQRGYATTFAEMGNEARQAATPWLNTGTDILSLNPEATGLSGEWMKNYNALSPESLVSFAASDAQRSIDNTRSQMVRTLSRSGVSPTSPAFAAALAQTKKYEQALLSGVKSRARLLGIKEQSAALQTGFKMALDSTAMGQQFTQQALTALSGASSATGEAMKGEAAAGQAIVTAGSLRAQGGSLTAQSANAVVSAANNLANAQQMAAEYYASQSSSILGMLQSGATTSLNALFD